MPRTRLDRKKHQELSILLNGCIYAFGGTMKDAADKLGMSRQTLGNRLQNPGEFTIDELLRFARVYNIEIDTLRGAIRK